MYTHSYSCPGLLWDELSHSISQLTFVGERGINLKIKQKLNNYTLAKKDKNFIIKISSSKEKTVIAKNISGNPTSFKSTVMVNVEVLMEDNYKNNLAETVTDKLIFKLSNIQ